MLSHANKKVERLPKLLYPLATSTTGFIFGTSESLFLLSLFMSFSVEFKFIDLPANAVVERGEASRISLLICRKHKRLICFWYFISSIEKCTIFFLSCQPRRRNIFRSTGFVRNLKEKTFLIWFFLLPSRVLLYADFHIAKKYFSSLLWKVWVFVTEFRIQM